MQYEAARAVIKRVPYLDITKPAWLQPAKPRPAVTAAIKPKRAADRELAGKLKQQAAQWASLHKKTTALTAGLRADELRYEASASATFSSFREQGNDIGRAIKTLQEGLDAASSVVFAQLPLPLEVELASGCSGNGDSRGAEQQHEEEPSAESAAGQLPSSAAAAAGTAGAGSCAAASAASGKEVSNSDVFSSTQAADSASGPAALTTVETATDGTVVVAAAGTPASSTASQGQVIEELGAQFGQLTLSQAVDGASKAGAAFKPSSNGFNQETDTEEQYSDAADGETIESTDDTDSTLASSFSIGGLLRLAMRAASGTK
jgi:hypothetical protein